MAAMGKFIIGSSKQTQNNALTGVLLTRDNIKYYNVSFIYSLVV